MIQKKICLLGASSVGKTSLVKQFVEGIFSEKYLTTIGVKIDKKTLSIANEQVNLLLWDMEGNDRYNVTDCPAILAINKSDLLATWHLDDSEYEAYQDLFALHFLTSAKTGNNVEQMFSSLAELLLKREKNDLTT